MTETFEKEAALATWHSDAYKHFNISLQHDFDPEGAPHELLFIFMCKAHLTQHKPHFRPHKKTSEGTSNLQSGITQLECFEHQGEIRPDDARVAWETAIPYTAAAHRALIALHCVKNHPPFNSVLDEDYKAEVNMLRPGTKLPHPATVSRDIQAIYVDMSPHICNYFQVSFYVVAKYENVKWQSNFRHKTTRSILLWMDGLRPLLRPFLGSWLSGMSKV